MIIQKPDLDTCLTGLICGVKEDDNIVVLSHDADEEDLRNPNVLCIESGGSGLAHLNNFDHHDPVRCLPPACRQAYEAKGGDNDELKRLVDYVCMVDEGLASEHTIEFPSLSNIFSGMLLIEPDKKRQFLKGLEILNRVLQSHIDPFSTMPDLAEWEAYRSAKIENQLMLSEALKGLSIYHSRRGIIIGFLQTEAIGGLEAIFARGCEVAVLYNPRFGIPPVVKFTIASRNIEVGHLIELLRKFEDGWGGRQRIIGSPRSGSNMKPEELLSLLIENF